MKNYKAMKTAGQWSVRKYGDRLQVIKKQWDSSTGTQGTDSTQDYSLSQLTNRISDIDAQIAELNNEKADVVQLEKDLKAL